MALTNIDNVETDTSTNDENISLPSSSSNAAMNYNFDAPNPFTTPIQSTGLGESELIKGQESAGETPSALKTFGAEAYEFNTPVQLAHYLYEKYQRPNITNNPAPAGWTPKDNIDKYVNVRPENLHYLMGSQNDEDQQYRYHRILEEQEHQDTINNGSLMSKVFGGLTGAVVDPLNLIPLVSIAKYAKVAPAFLKPALKAIPGALAYGAARSSVEELDKINGNMVDFISKTFVDTVFGTALFGTLGVGKLLTEKMSLLQTKNLTKSVIDGIDYKFNINDKGIIEGVKAFDTTGSLSAANVSYAQDLADSTFFRSGAFKIPYLGEGILKLQSNKLFGSPTVRLMTSPFNAVRGIADRIIDHTFMTKRIAEGGTSPIKFESLMKQEFARLRSVQTQYNALHLERNGFDIKNRIVGTKIDQSLYLRHKGLQLLGKEMDSTGYISKEAFNDEVQQVMHSKVPSQHAAVNEAATMMSKEKDEAYKAFRKAYNLPENFMIPATAEGFITRVYDTPYMNVNENQWNSVISKYLKDSDNLITERMRPIDDVTQRLEAHKITHDALIDTPNVSDAELKASRDQLNALSGRKKALEEQLHDDLRNDKDLNLLVHDYTGVSASEAKEIEGYTKRRDSVQKEVDKQKDVIRNLKVESQKREALAQKSATVKTAKGNKRKAAIGSEVAKNEQTLLDKLERDLEEENQKLHDLLQSGEVNPNLYRKVEGSEVRVFKNPNERLKFRDRFESDFHREQAAKAYYSTIMNQTAEDTIDQVMGRYMGISKENPLKSRSLMIPDQILYDNKFLTNDLMAKTANYRLFMARRTHLKNIFQDVSIDGGLEPVLKELHTEMEAGRDIINKKKAELETRLSESKVSESEAKKLKKEIANLDKRLVKENKRFNSDLKDLSHLYDKMMGKQNISLRARQVKNSIMAITSWVNLPFVPATQINDMTAIGMQHGTWPLIRDSIVPMIESLGGMLKTKDSEALREAAPHIHMALQDVQNSVSDRNFGSMTNPYLNMGKIVNSLEHISHSSSNFTGTAYVDNYLQRMTASATQSKIMQILYDFTKGSMRERDGLYLRKYGIDPEKWAKRMVYAHKQVKTGKTKLGGYISGFWKWEDHEASNVFGDAVFRTVNDTQLHAGLADSPFWTDDNGIVGIMGSIFKGFSGWGFASVNRYFIPLLQQPDSEKMVGMMMMLASGAMIDPIRRIARGEEPIPEKMTPKQFFWSAFNNSGVFSFFANDLATIDMLTGNHFLPNMRSDKFKDRTRAGILGPSWQTGNKIINVLDAMATGEFNENDAKKAVSMLPFANAIWLRGMENKLIESVHLPKTRAQARALKGIQ
jgi:hypothetical protein